MSLSGSSDSRCRSWATIRLAIWSSTGVPRKTMRSLSRRLVDVEGALASRRLLDHHGDKGAHGPRFVLGRRVRFLLSAQPSNHLSAVLLGGRTVSCSVEVASRASRARPASTAVPARRRCLVGPVSTACRAPGPARRMIGVAFSASRSIAARWARSSRSSSRRPAFSSRSRSFSGVVPLARGDGLQRVEDVAVGGLDALGLDDRGDHGLAAQRLLGVGLGLLEDLVLARARRSAGRRPWRCPGG